MNRGLLLGVMVFLALLGIALVGSDSQALAGHGCCGNNGDVACDGVYACGGHVVCGGVPCGGVYAGKGFAADCGCFGRMACAGRHRPLCQGGLFRQHRRAACGCEGVMMPVADCCGTVVGKGVMSYGPVQKGGPIQKGAVQKEGPVQKEGAAQKVTATARPFVFYQLSYRR